ncbi:hypothetical protein B0J14DRAFT_639142 [Halenospora varia]|nr:hypothetical protein B0J14DRAFT_639142 [Halenospora varia]
MGDALAVVLFHLPHYPFKLMDAMTGFAQNKVEMYQFANGTKTPYFPADVSRGNYNGTCDVTAGFGWGFASAWFYITLGLLKIWLLGTYAMWIDTQYNCKLMRQGREMGTLLAVMGLADAATEVLGPNTEGYSGPESEKGLQKQPWIQYEAEDNGQG